MLAGKKVLFGVSGSIAAYKIPLLVRMLVKAGAEVRVVMTPASAAFVSPLTLSTLSRNDVLKGLASDDAWNNHVLLGRWADIMVIAPLSCNTLAKMATGLCDNLLLAVYLSATCPVLAAPAMDEDMWQHPTTAANISALRMHNVEVMGVNTGELASGLHGAGRMPEPEEIMEAIVRKINTGPLTGKKVLVTAGPTYEAIDPVRFIGNHSSGKMGFALAEEFAGRGASVYLVTGPVRLTASDPNITTIEVQSAAEMLSACTGVDWDVAVMAAAVADYRPATVATEKMKKNEENGMKLDLVKTDDILATLGKRKKSGQILAGFALETNDGESEALRKLESKNADIIVLNTLADEGAGFGHDTNKVTLYSRTSAPKKIGLNSKKMIAVEIVNALNDLMQ